MRFRATINIFFLILRVSSFTNGSAKNASCGVASCELRVARCELRVASCELRVAVASCELRVTVTSCELQLRVVAVVSCSCELRVKNRQNKDISNPSQGKIMS